MKRKFFKHKMSKSLRLKFVFLILVVIFLSSCQSRLNQDYLTTEEKEWLKTNGNQLKLAIECNYPPFIFQNQNGQSDGISIDYIKYIEQQLGIQFERTHCSNLADVFEKVKKKELDIVTSVKKNPERSKFLLFTQPYIKIPTVIVVNSQVNDNLTVDQLNHKKIAVGNQYGVHNFLMKHYSHYNIVPVTDDYVGLQRLVFNEVDVLIADTGTISYIIDQTGISNMRIAGQVDYQYDLSLAVRKDLVLLQSILNKTINQMPDKTRRSIKEKWITLEITPFFLTREFFIFIFSLLGAILFIVIWNYTLHIKVKQRTKELADYKNHLEELVEARTLDLTNANEQLTEALANVNTLSGLLPICSNCKKVRNDDGYWGSIENYIQQHSDADFSHSLCPDCANKLYGDLANEKKDK
ncbi:MAG: transporter substrate-binding domain-containing protein [Spirochaetes bacterium]|nr:transporter substrate-binding domain-containing protein [Spirochaetota bacterium]